MRSDKLKEKVHEAYQSVSLLSEPCISLVSVRLGHIQQGAQELAANLADVLSVGANFFPGGLFNLRTVRLKFQEEQSLELPIYVDFGGCMCGFGAD